LPRPKVSKEAAQAEQRRRAVAIISRFTAELVAGDHGPQLAYLKSTAQFVVAACSRRAGKTWANCALLAMTALLSEGVTCVYVGISLDQVQRTAWRLWKAMLKTYGLEPLVTSSTEDMVTTFYNGSVVHFGSLQNERHANTWLGASLAGGIAIIDECQEASSDLLEAAERIIDPALTDTTADHPEPGRFVWSGTFPETQTGRFWELYSERTKEGSPYEVHTWNRFQNPFLRDQEKRLAEVLRKAKVTVDEPFIQRDWFGNPVYDRNATAYGFDPEKNTYKPTRPAWLAEVDLHPFEVMASVPPPGCSVFIVGIDPAGLQDRYAIEVWGFGKDSNALYQVFEAVTEKGANPLQSQANAVLGFINKHYQPVTAWVRDYGSAAITDDTLLREHGIANVEPAIKAALKARVDRMRDLLSTERAFVMEGSKLAEDFAKARWSLEAREKGQWKWHSSHHPDAADAAVYPLPHYFAFNEAKPAAPKTVNEIAAQLFQQALHPPSNTAYGYRDEVASGGDDGYGGPQ
jgi:hypothetical protein